MLGAAGGIGQPLSLLLKMNRMVSELALYDIANVAGVAADLSHCNTQTKACGAGCRAAGRPRCHDLCQGMQLHVHLSLVLAQCVPESPPKPSLSQLNTASVSCLPPGQGLHRRRPAG